MVAIGVCCERSKPGITPVRMGIVFSSRHVGGRQDADDAGEFQRGSRIDFDDARMRVRAAQNRRMHHAGAVNIADVFADAAQKPHVFFALNS